MWIQYILLYGYKVFISSVDVDGKYQIFNYTSSPKGYCSKHDAPLRTTRRMYRGQHQRTNRNTTHEFLRSWKDSLSCYTGAGVNKLDTSTFSKGEARHYGYAGLDS
jgi:hypothetical protein